MANYETGRSQPDDFTLNRIAEKAGVSPDYFTSNHDPIAGQSLAAAAGSMVEGMPDWTEDEAALVRVLRLCDPETVCQVLDQVTSAVAQQEFLATIDSIYAIAEDIQRLREVASEHRVFEKGPLADYPEDDERHCIGFKPRTGPGPK